MTVSDLGTTGGLGHVEDIQMNRVRLGETRWMAVVAALVFGASMSGPAYAGVTASASIDITPNNSNLQTLHQSNTDLQLLVTVQNLSHNTPPDGIAGVSATLRNDGSLGAGIVTIKYGCTTPGCAVTVQNLLTNVQCTILNAPAIASCADP